MASARSHPSPVASGPSFYQAFGFNDVDVAFSSRPPLRAGDDAVWDRAERILEEAASKAGLQFRAQPGEGAFYGPKLDFSLKDRLGRWWQCGTIQLDFVLPERFELTYVDTGGERKRPAMLHRALFGSVERFLGVLLEHYRGALPPWLAPEQVVVAPVGVGLQEYAQCVLDHLRGADIRVRLDDRSETLARRIVDAHQAGVPYVVVIGGRELSSGSIHIRERSGEQCLFSLEEAAKKLRHSCSPPKFKDSP